MSLQIWLPLTKDTANYGIASAGITTNNITLNDSGKLGKCAAFNGSDSFISLNSAALNNCFAGSTQAVTIAFWIKHTDTNRAIIFGDYGLTGAISFNLELKASSTSDWRYYWAGSPDQSVGTNVAPADGAWHHCAIVYTGTQLKAYKDGVLAGNEVTVTLAAKTKTTGVWYIGRDSRTGATAFNGYLNDFRVYNNALSEDEIKKLAQGLILHWPLTKAPETLLHTYYTALPNEYQEVEYLESTGTQYIQTDYLHKSNTVMGLRFMWLGAAGQTAWIPLCGTRENSNAAYFNFFINASNYHSSCNYTYSHQEDAGFSANPKVPQTWVAGDRKFYVNGVLKQSYNIDLDAATTNSMCIFCISNGNHGKDNRNNAMRLYNWYVQEDGVTMRYIVPCYRKSDNKPGVYDIITSTFYTNAGTGEFICGPLIKSIPNTYLPLEYIESTGTQEIRNNIAITANSILKTAVMATQDVTAERSFVGASSSFEWYFKNSQIQIWKNATTASTTYPINAQINIKYELTMKNTADESNVSLFGYNGSSYRFIGRMYYFITTNSSGLTTHDMRPALRVSDKKPGMYDLVTDTFYVNAGSGDFTYSTYTIEYDISGYHYDGTVLNAPAVEFDAVRYKNILHINATNQKVKATGIITTGFQNSYTIAWWANFASGQSGAMHWGFGGGTRLNGLYSNGRLWNTGDGNDNPIYAPGTTTQVPSNADLAGQWHHWAMTGNGTKCYLYKDGELYGEAKTYKSLNCASTEFYLNGWNADTNYSSSNSKYSDLRIYSTALSAAEIKELYDMGHTA